MILNKIKNFSLEAKFQIPLFGLLFLLLLFLFDLAWLTVLTLLFLTGTLLFCWKSKISLVLGLVLVLLMPLFLILDKEGMVASLGVYAFSFLTIGVVGAIFEYNRSQGNFYPDLRPHIKSFFGRWRFGGLLEAFFDKKKRQRVKGLFKQEIRNIFYSRFLKVVVWLAVLIFFIFARTPFLSAIAPLVFLAVILFYKKGFRIAKIGLGLFVICAILFMVGQQGGAKVMAEYVFYFLAASTLIEWRSYLREN